METLFKIRTAVGPTNPSTSLWSTNWHHQFLRRIKHFFVYLAIASDCITQCVFKLPPQYT